METIFGMYGAILLGVWLGGLYNQWRYYQTPEQKAAWEASRPKIDLEARARADFHERIAQAFGRPVISLSKP
jgi:hypothetical protein